MNMSDYLETNLRTLIFRTGAGLTKPADLYVGLTTALPTDASTGSTVVEPVGNGYARIQIDPLDANWTAASSTDGVTTNNVALEWTATGGAWSEVAGIFIADASTAGNVLFHGSLDTPKTLAVGETLTIDQGALSIAFS